MLKIINSSCRYIFTYNKSLQLYQRIRKRTFLSNAYYCQEVWNARLKSPILQKVDLDDFYHELESNFNKTKTISAVDVDIFVNAIQNDSHIDELLDLVHKLRLSAETGNTLPSTEHAVIRNLTEYGHYDKLLHTLNDRLNYGIFLDNYTASLLLNTFWKKNDYTAGAKIASQIMLQEDFSHPFVTYLSLLHCYKFLQNPIDWEEPPVPVEPEEEIKIRVKYIRNSYFDDHFDLQNPIHIVGKTIAMASNILNNPIGKSFKFIGLALQNKNDKAELYLHELKNQSLISQIVNLLPDDNDLKTKAKDFKLDDLDVEEALKKKIEETEKNCSEKDIADQCETYDKWIQLRQEALEKQQKRLDTAHRLAAIEDKANKLKEKEKLLWYFEKQEQIELEIKDKQVFYPKRWFGKKKKPRKVDESYVPPDIQKTYNKQ